MSHDSIPLDVQAAEDLLLRLLAIDGVTGEEAAIAAAVSEELQKVGVPPEAIRFDEAHQKIPLPTQTGNLIVELPGTRPGPRLLFSTHLDTVPLCAGAKPRREGTHIVSDGTTALGGDNRTGCAVLIAMVETLLKHKLPHPPLTLLFTVREESGLHGARELDPADLGGATMGFNVDGKLASELIIGAVGQTNWDVEIIGKASHAGVAPEKGISATLVAAIALTEARRGGWFGKVVKGDRFGSSNAGIFGGKNGKAAGDATNVVTDYVHIKGEARSPDAA
ncbi:MAG: M28 family peptidase, partial [Planctomycetaceae bacterium]|nr:M28 family peptidase [Planctomycetaceae bacterium]